MLTLHFCVACWFFSQPDRLLDLPNLFKDNNAVRYVYRFDAGWVSRGLVRQLHCSFNNDGTCRGGGFYFLPRFVE